jgi:hypothetical protein
MNERGMEILDLGALLGERQALSLVAGKCLAANAECLRRIRDAKAYRVLDLTWDEFCRQHVGASRPSVDKTIRLFEEFGPAIFELSSVMHIGEDEYRGIAGSITPHGILFENEMIPIAPESLPKVIRAVDALLVAAAPTER